MEDDVVVLGSGMAGLGAAHRIRESGARCLVIDKNAYSGGHTASHNRDGFIFDEGPHVSFTKDARIQKLLVDSVGGDYLNVEAYVDNYWQGRSIRHPVITNLHGLPEDIIVRVIGDYVDSKRSAGSVIANYEDWLLASYGRTYAELFPMQYTRKYHTTSARNLSTEWVGPRLYQAALEEVLRGALSPASPNVHYVQDYRYPRFGGFASFLRGLEESANILLNHRVISIDISSRNLRFSNGATRPFGQLVSSIPLPDLIPMIAGAPPDVLAAAEQLACTTVVLVNLGVNRRSLSKASWRYFYDDEFPFSRVSFPCNYSPNVAPTGMGSIQAEVYYSRKYRPLTTAPEACIQPTIDGLRRCGVLHDDDKIVLQEASVVPYANIIFDLDRAKALATVHGFLESCGIAWCGRYGDWGYIWTDEAFISGENAAQKVLDRRTH